MKMTAMKIALEELTLKMRRVMEEPDKDDGIWFQHKSPVWLEKLTPLTYKELLKVRPDYNIDWRRETEEQYHKLMPSPFRSDDSSFLYATIVGYNNMEDPAKYPGFTYYFRLSKEQIDSTLFEIVDAEHRRPASRGINAMMSCILEWDRHKHKYKSYHEEGLGDVDPRIEVIIPTDVFPELYFPQEEDR